MRVIYAHLGRFVYMEWVLWMNCIVPHKVIFCRFELLMYSRILHIIIISSSSKVVVVTVLEVEVTVVV